MTAAIKNQLKGIDIIIESLKRFDMDEQFTVKDFIQIISLVRMRLELTHMDT